MATAAAPSAAAERPPRGRRRGRPSVRRERLLEAALALFNREGFHAVGIDRILAEAGVAKMTLYKHFPSKQALILAALQHRNQRILAWYDTALTARGGGPRERLLGLFDVLGDWFDSGDFHGCLFVKAAGEYPDPADPAHKAAADYKRALLGLLTGLAEQAGASSPRLLAQRLLLLVEGATVLALVLGGREAARQARDTAALLVRQMLPKA